MASDYLKKLAVGIALVAAYVNNITATVGDDIMLLPGIYLGNSHLYIAKQRRTLRIFVVSEPIDILYSLVYCIYTFVACRMACYAFCSTVENHKALFGYRRVHSCRLAYYGTVYRGKQGYYGLDTVLSGDFLLGRSKEYCIIALRILTYLIEDLKHCNQ